MAYSYYNNALHVNFESVLTMDDPGMVSMFQALMASDLEGFLGCPAVIYEAALVYFIENASVRDGVVVSTVHGVTVEISEQLFAETFELPVEGLSELLEIPKDLVFDARSIVSLFGEPISTSGKKREMKFEYRLLCDIMAKTISIKVGSFNAITMEKFLMLTAIVCGVRINWTSILFNILKKMMTPGSKQAKGYAVQISLLLENVPNLELGESSELPYSRILTDKTIHRYIVLNEKVGAEEVAAAPQVKKAPKKQATSKKRPAAAAVREPVLKKKRTMKKKSGTSKESLEIVVVAQEAVPIQIIAPIPAAPAADETSKQPAAAGETGVQEPAAEHMDEQLEEPTADEDIVVENITEPAIGDDEEVHEVGISGVGDQTAETADREKHLFDLPYEDIIAQMDAERAVVTASDTDEEMETIDAGTGTLEEVEMSDDDQSVCERIVEDEDMSLEDILMTIPVDVPLPSAGMEITKITLGKDITISGVDERTWYLANLPKIKPEEKGKKPLLEKDPVQGNPVKEQILLILADIECLVQLRENTIDEVAKFFFSFSFKMLAKLQIDDSYFAKEELLLSWAEAESTGVALQRRILHTLDKGLRDALLQQGENLLKLIQNFRQDGRNLNDVQTLRFNEFRKGFLAHSAAVTVDSMDFRKEFRALNAKVTSLDVQVVATRNDLLEFSAQAQETLNHITDQLSKLIAYINRGGNDKKGEVSSNRPQPPPDDQNRGSGNSGGGSGVRSTDIVDRFSGSMSKDGQNRGRSGGRHSSGNRSGSSNRRHYSSSGGPFRRSFEDWLG
ncbi:hypothetical protein F511_33072 [Dorcoceras hygrometricum]|uniref:Dystroglycan-like n=1 Tax=Dorcoceras hygrometricum TaxID=472368 RepID=A0A2Z7BEJ0_9LAMI|nr:hypothetical protein F511_33072 [Dorcoceras hygrometricum]